MLFFKVHRASLYLKRLRFVLSGLRNVSTVAVKLYGCMVVILPKINPVKLLGSIGLDAVTVGAGSIPNDPVNPQVRQSLTISKVRDCLPMMEVLLW